MWLVKSNPIGYVRFTNGTTQYTGSTSLALELAQNISGSGLTFDLGSTIGIEITASETSFETTKQFRNHTLNIAKNFAPSGSMIPSSSNLNTNGARVGNPLVTLTWTDVESNTLNNSTFTLTSNTGLSSSWNGGYVYTISPTGSVSAGTYFVSASVKDQYGFRFGSSSVSFTIAQAGTGSLTTNAPFYVIESAVSGNLIYTSTNGRSGTQGDLGVTYSLQYNSAAVASFTSSNAIISVASNGNLSIAQNVSGSAFTFDAGNPITSNITWIDQYGNIGGPTQISVNIAINNAPTVTGDSPSTNNHNTNLAVAGAQLATLTWSDTESDALNVGSFSLSGVGASLLSSSYNGSNVFKITALNNLSAGTILYTASIEDVRGFRTGTYNDLFVITQASSGSLSTPNTYFIVESAVSGNFITRDSDGSGSAASASVSYPAGIGNPTATNFSASDAFAVVRIHPTTAVLSINQNFSGSVSLPTEGNSFTARIFWNDIYQSGSGDINISVTNNLNPTASFANANLTAPVTTNTTLVTVTLTDPEVTTPFSMSLSGLSATSMSAVPQNAGSSSYLLKNSVDINDGVTLSYTASVFDAYNNQVNFNRTLTISAPVAASPLWYLYTSEPGQYATTDLATYLATYGDTNDDGTTDAGYPFDNLTGGTIGQSSFTSSAYTGFGDNNVLVASGSILSGSNTTPLISNLNHLNLGFMIVFPSSSEVGITPSSMTNALAGSTTNQYVLFSDRPGTGALNDNPQTSFVRYFNLDSGTYPNSSATRFGVIFVGGGSSNITYFLMASSGSAPTSTQ